MPFCKNHRVDIIQLSKLNFGQRTLTNVRFDKSDARWFERSVGSGAKRALAKAEETGTPTQPYRHAVSPSVAAVGATHSTFATFSRADQDTA
jgi:hypothetical protein